MSESENKNNSPDLDKSTTPQPPDAPGSSRTSDDEELEKLILQHEADKARFEAERKLTPTPLREAVRQAVSRAAPPQSRPSDDELARRDRERELAARQREINDRLRTLITARGERYAGCTLESYRTSSSEQQAVVAALSEFSEGIGRAARNGEGGLILYGPRGTGKDHLMFALMSHAIRHADLTVKWVNGMDLLGDIRDRIQTGEQESALIRSLANPDILAISDPLPPFGSLTEFQATMLFRVIDARYSRRKPLWVTVNVANRAEFEERMGAQLVDRLIDGALVVFCNWPSYREVRKRP